MLIVYQASDYLEAHLVAGMLQSRGLQAYVCGEYLQGGIGEMAPLGFAQVGVSEEDYALAYQLVQEYSRKDPDSET
ncbi:putative signal transducing protein [Marinospirillum perlucidum]|uniref:putative signal transducing protein n=1 Tax=Marinospirillum perlucidum TaxID=1982602 RepID=UPI000DF3345D|nr:DUF2007 domain-containing protein [Marinospirillum perlucidum]